MLDVRINTIIYQSQVYYSALINELVENKKYGKALDSKWTKADLILAYLEALGYVDRLTNESDRTEVNYILNCLIKLCELNVYPVNNPLVIGEVPTTLVGVKGDTGDTGATGPRGFTGLATDFQITCTGTTTEIDSFDLTDSTAARWDYVVTKSTGERRAGTIIGHWGDDGVDLDLYDISDNSTPASTSDLQFTLQVANSIVSLVATTTSGTWIVKGARYFIPNNGNGSGPIADVLSDGKIYIGNTSNNAQERAISGVISITNTGVVSFTPGSIIDNSISSTASIALSKLASLTANKVVATNGVGVLYATTIDPALLSGIGNFLLKTGDTMTGVLSMGGNKITNTAPGTTSGDVIIFDQLPTSTEGVVSIITNTYTITAGAQNKKLNFDYAGKRFINIAAASQLSEGVFIWIKDSALTASTYNMVVRLNTGDTFEDGSDQLTINTDGNCIGIYTDGISKFFILEERTVTVPAQVSIGLLTYKEVLLDSTDILLKTQLLKAYKNMALKTKISTSGSDTFTVGSNGSRIYLISFNSTSPGGNVEISDDGSNYYTLVSSGGTIPINANAVNSTDIPAVLTEEGTGLKFYPIGAGATVRLSASGVGVIVTYYDL